MPDYLIAPVVLHLPAFLICVVFFLAGLRAEHKSLGRFMRISALIWLVVLWCVFTFVTVSAETCSGSLLFGLTNCTVIPAGLANISLMLFLFTVGFGTLYGALTAIVGGVIEWRHRASLTTI